MNMRQAMKIHCIDMADICADFAAKLARQGADEAAMRWRRDRTVWLLKALAWAV